MQFKIHVLLVSQQAAPNFLPLLDEALKPEAVILLVTDQMKPRAIFLESAIRPLGIKVKQVPFEAVGSFNQLQNQLFDLLKPYSESRAHEIALNATGGTKWMAITAQEVFRMNGSPVFYVDIDSGTVLFLDSEREPQSLSKKVKLKDYLTSYGYSIKNEETTIKGLKEKHKEFCQKLVGNVGQWGAALGQLNMLASKADEKKKLDIKLDELDSEDEFFKKILKECEYAELLTYNKEKITFVDEDARFFINGGWLEHYINSILNELKKENILQDSSRLNLKVVSADGASNEIDIAFMANNKLHIIECKTKRFIGKNTGGAGIDSIYKLDSISALGGLGTKAMLVSYRPLGEADERRAKELKIKVIQHHDIKNIKSAIKDWIYKKNN